MHHHDSMTPAQLYTTLVLFKWMNPPPKPEDIKPVFPPLPKAPPEPKPGSEEFLKLWRDLGYRGNPPKY